MPSECDMPPPLSELPHHMEKEKLATEHALSCVAQLMQQHAPDCKEVMETAGNEIHMVQFGYKFGGLNTNFYNFGASLYQMQVSRKNMILSKSFVRFLNVKNPW
jgi:hypothetical protein